MDVTDKSNKRGEANERTPEKVVNHTQDNSPIFHIFTLSKKGGIPVPDHEAREIAEIADVDLDDLSELIRVTNQNWEDVIFDSSRMGSDLLKHHKIHSLKPTSTWIDKINLSPISDVPKLISAFKGDILCATPDFKKIYPALRLRFISDKVTQIQAEIKLLQDSMQDMMDGCENLPKTILPSVINEVLLNAYALREFSLYDEKDSEYNDSEIKLEDETCLISLLRSVDPELVEPYQEARNNLALCEKGDLTLVRGFLVSIRTLFDKLLEKIAPEEQVAEWILEGDESLILNNGKPNRRAQILYAFRDLGHGDMEKFVADDTNALVSLRNVLNTVHELGLRDKFSNRQLHALMLRVESWMTLVIPLWKKHTPKEEC